MKKIHFLINPASGKQVPILSIINQAFQSSSIEWEVSVVTKPGDEITLARQLIQSDISALAVYGGDGTITSVVQAVYPSEKPIIVLPGGTANVFAASLCSNLDIVQMMTAVSLNQLAVKHTDIALVNGRPMLLAITTGLLAQNIIDTAVADKNRIGGLAYYINTLKVLPAIEPSNFELEIDHQHISCQAVAVVIANSGQFSVGGFQLSAGQDNADGKVDILAVHQASPASLINALSIKDEIVSDTVSYWKAASMTLSVPAGVPILLDDVPVATPWTCSIEVHALAGKFLVPEIPR